MRFVTDFADQAVLLPAALCVALVLAAAGWRRGLLAWAAAVGGVLLCMLGLKAIGLQAARYGARAAFSPSGHVAAACVLYGGLAMLLLRRVAAPRVTALVPLCIAGIVGTTRIALHAHDLAEVLVGGLVGVSGAVLLCASAGPPPPRVALPLVAAVLLPALLLHGIHLGVEQAIRAAFGSCAR